MKEDQQLSFPFSPRPCFHLLKHLVLEIFPIAENQNLLILACKSNADSHQCSVPVNFVKESQGCGTVLSFKHQHALSCIDYFIL